MANSMVDRKVFRKQLSESVETEISGVGLKDFGEDSAIRPSDRHRKLLKIALSTVGKSMGLDDDEIRDIEHCEKQFMRIVDPNEKGVIFKFSEKSSYTFNRESLNNFFLGFTNDLNKYIKSGSTEIDFGKDSSSNQSLSPNEFQTMYFASLRALPDDKETIDLDFKFGHQLLTVGRKLNEWRIRDILGQERGEEYLNRRKLALNIFTDQQKRLK